MDIREFLEARLAEDELWALACSAPSSWRGEHRPITTGVHWTWAVGDNWDPYPIDPLEEYAGESAHDTSPCLVTVERWPYSDSTLKSAWKDFQHQAISRVDEIRSAEAGHIARHDPARVLRDVEAKRRLLRDVLPEVEQMAGLIEHEYGAAPDRVGTGVADMVLRLVALSWSDHPDYDPSWSPESVTGDS